LKILNAIDIESKLNHCFIIDKPDQTMTLQGPP